MATRSKVDLRSWSFLNRAAFVLAFVTFFALSVQSKDTPPLTAIELFDGPNGAAYVQVTELLINGKAELRSCGGVTEISKSSYGKLTKISLNPAPVSLQRDAKGVMTLNRGSGAECVVPSNLKFDKDETLALAQIADRAQLQGQVLSSSPAGITAVPTFKPGVKIVFVTAPDTELAEYLRADRAQTVAQWQDYLARYTKTPHTDAAKQSLAALQLKECEASLTSYRSSAGTNSPAYADLRSTFLEATQVHDLLPANDAANTILEGVHAELTQVTSKGRAELQTYKKALAAHTSGYVHLAAAQQLTNHVLEVDPHFDQGLAVQSEVQAESSHAESALHNGESLIAAQHYDEAVAAVAEYRSFADEEPRISAIINAAYNYHFDRAKANSTAAKANPTAQKWHDAVLEYQKASELKPTPEAAAALKQAQAEFQTATNRAAADYALQVSNGLQLDKRYIEAYEVLADLIPAQRALVKDQMQALEADYIKSASDEAQKLHDAHIPIHGQQDEIAVQKAYNYLHRASELKRDDENLALRLNVLAIALSDYYVDRAKKYLEKPLGSGAGIAWLYLDEAQQYEPNRDDLHDLRTKYSAINNLRSKLSIKVVFRDQTSRRDSAGFADQLSDSIATGLETTNLPVKVIRASESTPVEPNFQLIGDVLEHRPIAKPSVESVESEYRAAEREVPNEEWNKVNRDYEAANLDLQRAQKVLEGAQAHGKKKEIDAASKDVEDTQNKVEDIHRKLDSIPKTNLSDIVKPYTYTKRTIDLTGVVELGFRIVDSTGNIIAAVPSIKETNHDVFVVLENVKPEDTKGVKQVGVPPDEAQYIGDVEIKALADLIKDVKMKVESLPATILAQARKQVRDGDTDGAAESYILYLNSTSDAKTPERDEAKKFLLEQFNMVWPGSLS